MAAAGFKIKNPDAPASDAQINAIVKMVEKAGVECPAFAGMTKGEASAKITELGEMLNGAPEPQPKVSLVEMAKAIESPKPQAGALAFTAADAKVALSWFPVMAAEVDVTEEDERVMELLQLIASAVEIKGLEEAVQSIAAEKFPKHEIPDGHYAIGDPADTKFYRVQNGVDKTAKGGKDWSGYVFIEQQASDDFYAVKSPAVKATILKAIKDQGVLESAKRYGHELGVCGVCHKTLTDPESIAAGIGPVCAKKLGA